MFKQKFNLGPSSYGRICWAINKCFIFHLQRHHIHNYAFLLPETVNLRCHKPSYNSILRSDCVLCMSVTSTNESSMIPAYTTHHPLQVRTLRTHASTKSKWFFTCSSPYHRCGLQPHCLFGFCFRYFRGRWTRYPPLPTSPILPM